MGAIGRAVARLRDGEELHALSDGREPLWEVIHGLAELVGPGCSVVALTSAANAVDCAKVMELEVRGRAAEVRIIAWFHALRGNGERGAAVVREVGGRLRCAHTHAKGAVARLGDRFGVVQTTANLNPNRRIESYTVTMDGAVGREWWAMVEALEASGAEPGRDGAYYLRTWGAVCRGSVEVGTLRGEIGRWR